MSNTAQTSREDLDKFWEWLEKRAQCTRDPDDGPDWFDAFPPQLNEFTRSTVIYEHFPDQITYSRPAPDSDGRRWTDHIRITYEDGTFIAREQVEEDGRLRWRNTPDSVVFRQNTAIAAANALQTYLLRDESGTTRSTRRTDPAQWPDWFDTFPRQVGDHERGEMVDADSTAHLTYYRRVPDRHVPVDMVRITCEDGVFTAREQVEVHGRLRWQDTADSVVFQREADTAAADALVQYLLDGVDPDVYHNPDPNQVWPPEDLFTADTA